MRKKYPLATAGRTRLTVAGLILLTAAGSTLLTGCAGPMAGHTETTASAQEEMVEFHGVSKAKSELSEDTLKWLQWYDTLSEKEQMAVNFVPTEFITPGSYAIETDEAAEVPAYAGSLTEEELADTEALAYYYFTEGSTGYDGVEEIQLAPDDFSLYQNTGIEAEYDPGNIIIYRVLTGKDKAEGNPMRSISIARRSKADQWKVINSGF